MTEKLVLIQIALLVVPFFLFRKRGLLSQLKSTVSVSMIGFLMLWIDAFRTFLGNEFPGTLDPKYDGIELSGWVWTIFRKRVHGH